MAKLNIDRLLDDLGGCEGTPTADAPNASVDIGQDGCGPLGWDASAFSEIHTPKSAPRRIGGSGALLKSLVRSGVVGEREATQTKSIIKQSPGARLLEVLHSQGIDEEVLLKAVADELGLTFERLDLSHGPGSVDSARAQRLGTSFCKDNLVMPIRTEGRRVVLAVAYPDDVLTIDDAKMLMRTPSVRVIAVPAGDIREAIELLEDTGEAADVESILSDIEEDDVQVREDEAAEVDLEREAAESPVIRYVNFIIQSAVKEGASDIHIEPGENSLKVRFRIDGVLFDAMQPPGKMAAAITSRLKIMGNLDISERRIPQDGRIRCTVQGRKLDLRMSTLPCANGEKTVMRILDTRSINVGLDDLGFGDSALQLWKSQIVQPHGIVLVTGPTGSGKTTTLYASLAQMDKVTKNISTVEDPIEYHLGGITQTQMHEKIGMTFAKALKALLRQDPDIIMVGEIRDEETAHTAIQAALTGHLVLSTLHTNDAPSAITRLVNIGLEPFLIGAAINGVLAQRLVRKICEHCKQPAEMNDELREFALLQGIETSKIMSGPGCERCRRLGYSGRLGLYELLVVDDQLRDIIARNPNVTEFRRLCCERGMVTLRQDGFKKVGDGKTSVEEILRVTEATV